MDDGTSGRTVGTGGHQPAHRHAHPDQHADETLLAGRPARSSPRGAHLPGSRSTPGRSTAPAPGTPTNIIWVDAPLTIDGDDATYDYAYDTGIDRVLADRPRRHVPGRLHQRAPGVRDGGQQPAYRARCQRVGLFGRHDGRHHPAHGDRHVHRAGRHRSWTPSTAYRYWQLVQTTEDSIRVHKVELLTAATSGGGGGTTIHGLLTGRTR